MSDPVADIRAAEARAAAARADLGATLGELQARLNLKALTREGVRKVADAGQSAARNGADAARRNPMPLAGVVALGALFVARHRIAALFRRTRPGAAKRRHSSASKSKEPSDA